MMAGIRCDDLVRAKLPEEEIVGAVTAIEEPQPGKTLITINPFDGKDKVRMAADLVEVAR